MANSANVGSFSKCHCFQWKVPDLFSLNANVAYQSPSFSSLECTWYLELKVYKNDSVLNNDRIAEFAAQVHRDIDFNDVDVSGALIGDIMHVTLNLFLKEGESSNKGVVLYALGIKMKDGTLEERSCTRFPQITKGRRRKCSGRVYLVPRNRLKKNMTFTCRMEMENPVDVVNLDRHNQKQLTDLEVLSSDFENLLASKKKCDTTIKVMGREFQAHRAVLAARSCVFSAMFQHGMSEDSTGVLVVKDCDPDSFGEFLHYLYTGRIEEFAGRNVHNLYMLADKYDVQALKSSCRAHMTHSLNTENIIDAVTFAEQWDDAVLMSEVQIFFNANVAEILAEPKWEAMMRDDHRLANKLLKELHKVDTGTPRGKAIRSGDSGKSPATPAKFRKRQ